MRKLTNLLVPISALFLAMPAFAAADQAEVKAQGAQEEEIEEIIVSGLRGKPRTAVDSAVPVDYFDVSTIENVAHNDVQNILQTLVPSYNVARQPISDGASFIRPEKNTVKALFSGRGMFQSATRKFPGTDGARDNVTILKLHTIFYGGESQ